MVDTRVTVDNIFPVYKGDSDSRITVDNNFALFRGDSVSRVTVDNNFAVFKGDSYTRCTTTTCFAIVKLEFLPESGLIYALGVIDLSSISYDFVKNSYLYLYNNSSTPWSGTVSLYAQTVSWETANATWILRGAGNPWSTPGGQSGVDFNAIPFASFSVSPSENSWFRVEVTDWLNSVLPSKSTHGFWFRISSSGFFSVAGTASIHAPYFQNTPLITP